MAKDFWAKYKDPRWQKRRLEVMEFRGWRCQECGSDTKTLNVHHKLYRKGADPWEYSNEELACLCESCHGELHGQMDALKAVLSTLDPFEVPHIHALIVGYRGGILQSDVSEGEPFSMIPPGDWPLISYHQGFLAMELGDLPLEDLLLLGRLYRRLNPHGFADFIRQAWAVLDRQDGEHH